MSVCMGELFSGMSAVVNLHRKPDYTREEHSIPA